MKSHVRYHKAYWLKKTVENLLITFFHVVTYNSELHQLSKTEMTIQFTKKLTVSQMSLLQKNQQQSP